MQLGKLKQRKKELIRYLEKTRDYKAETIRFVEDLELKYSKGEILDSEFYYKLNKALKNKSLRDWIDYYDNLISQYNKELNQINNELRENESIVFNAKTVLIVLIFVMLSITAVIFFKSEITGLTIYQQGEIINDTITLNIPANLIINESIVKVNLNSQEKILSLNNFNIELNLATIDLSKFNLLAENGTLITQIIFNNSIINETSLVIETQVIQPAPPENITGLSNIKFDRNLDCARCGQHKAPSNAVVNMTIKTTFEGTTNNNELIDYYPISWTILNANGGIVSNYDTTWNKISWSLNNNTNYIERSYIIQVPTQTIPPTKYDFKSELASIQSDLWQVIVADPSFGVDNRTIGFEYLDNNGNIVGEASATVIHIWNNKDDYYFNKTSGIQFSNHFDEYWTHNIFCGGYKDAEGNWIYDCNDELPFNWNIKTDNNSYANYTGWRDKTIGNKTVRLGIRYHLKNNDTNITAQFSVENIGLEDISNDLGFAWNVRDIKIGNTRENDRVDINGSKYVLNETLNLIFKGGEIDSIYNIEDVRGNKKQFLYLDWNGNLNYLLNVTSVPNQYNAPITLAINAGPLVQGQQKATEMFWRDAGTASPNRTVYNMSVSSGTTHFGYTEGTQNLAIPPAFTAARDTTTQISSACYTATTQSDDSRCQSTQAAGADEPWIRFNFTIVNFTKIDNITITMEAICNACDANEDVYFIHMNYTNAAWGIFAPQTTAEATRTIFYNTEADIANLINFEPSGTSTKGQLVILAEGSNLDAAESISVDNLQVVVTQQADQPPTITTPSFNQTTYYTNTIINSSITPTDSDDATVDVTFEWYKNDVLIRRTTNTGISSGSETTDTLGFSEFTSGDKIIVQGFAFDQILNSTLTNSTTTTIKSYGQLSVNVTSPVNNTNYSQGKLFYLNATVTCLGEGGENTLCGTVYANARYNQSSAFPDYLINTSEASPFYVSGGGGGNATGGDVFRPYQTQTLGVTDPANSYDLNINDTTTFATVGADASLGEINYSYDLGDIVQGQIFYYTKKLSTASSFVRIFNNTNSSFLEVLSIPEDLPLRLNNTQISINNGLINATGGVLLQIHQNAGLGELATSVSDTYIIASGSSPNPQSQVLTGGQQFNVTWAINFSGTGGYKIDTLFNSSLRTDVQDNATTPITVCIGATSCVAEAQVNSPPNNISNLRINSTTLLQLNLTTENLQVRFNVSDPNAGDTLNYSIQWFTNNRTNFTLTNIAVSNPGTAVQTLDNKNTTKWQNWSAQILVCDNSNACNRFVNTSALYIRNSNATITQPAFNQTSFKDSGYINISLVFSDDDQDNNDVTFEWYRTVGASPYLLQRTTNSNLANGTNTSDTLSPALTSTNDQIIVQAFAFDGERNSTLLNSTTITIQSDNTAPNNPSSLIINSTTLLQLNLTDEDLRMNFLCDDPDASDTLTFHLTAFENYVNMFQLQGGCNDPEYKSVLLDNLNTTKFGNWSFSVNVSDVANAYSATISSIINITIRNSIPIIGNITLDEADNIVLTENGNKSFVFSFVVTDADNFTDINNFSAVANVTRGFGSTAETTRHNDTFVYPTDGGCRANKLIGTNGKNFSCTIEMVFYDAAGLWNISARINDTNDFAQNTTKTFTVQESTNMQIDQSTISFPQITPNVYNISSLLNLTITNTGNDDISGRETTGETINITAITLVPSTGTTFIPASNFTIGQVNASGTFNGDYCDPSIVRNVTRLRNVTDAAGFSNFTGAVNGSAVLAQAVGNKHTLGICLIHAPNDLQSTTYSTTSSGAWTITIFFFRRRKNKLYEENKNIINSIIELRVNYKLSNNDLIKLINYEKELILIPISIFRNASPLEALVKYLKDNLGLSLHEISVLLNRDDGTIWITYNNASKKITKLDVTSEILISINIFHNRKLSILENLITYLYGKEISLSRMAALLNRDYKTIYTVYKRAKDKHIKYN